jgi:DUF1365 family protein
MKPTAEQLKRCIRVLYKHEDKKQVNKLKEELLNLYGEKYDYVAPESEDKQPVQKERSRQKKRKRSKTQNKLF